MSKAIDREPCCVCGEPGADRAHLRTRGAGAKNEWHEYIWLCRKHHIEQGNSGWKKFLDKHKEARPELSKRGWHLIQEFKVWKLRKIK